MTDSDTAAIKVLLVEGHPIMRFGIAAIINARPDMTSMAQASTGTEAIEFHRSHQPNVTLMDLRLPDMSGFEAIRRIFLPPQVTR